MAVILWAVYLTVIAGIVAVQPDRRTVTPEYREAALEWWAGKDIYEVRMHGYLYLPQAAILYTPFAALPERVGEPLWRLVGLSLFAWSIWRLCMVFGGKRHGIWFLVATVAAVPASFSAARNGQMNLTMAALLGLSAVDLGRHAWNRAGISLLLSVALKPLGVVPCLLAGGCYMKPMGGRLIAGVALLAGLAFLHANPEYVLRQYELFVETMQIARKPKQSLFCDIQGMFWAFGFRPPDLAMSLLRIVAAGITLGVAWLGVRRYDAQRAGFICMLMAAWYLLLFNPRTETNSYVLIAPFAGVLVAAALVERINSRRLFLLGIYALALSCENWGPLHAVTNLWLKAAVTLVFGGVLIRDVLLGRAPLGLRKNADSMP
jgi:alpha-1,2-mannosyltransferase